MAAGGIFSLTIINMYADALFKWTHHSTQPGTPYQLCYIELIPNLQSNISFH